jgi:ubiquinone/menaquinone biosynthesis C-methylase UbiE
VWLSAHRQKDENQPQRTDFSPFATRYFRQENEQMTTSNLRVGQAGGKPAKAYKGPAMEGMIARWYAKNTKQGREFSTLAERLSKLLPSGSQILEVAPGPGYLAIELAKQGNYQIVGLDISKTFVEIAQANANAAGVKVHFRQGNAAAIPFEAETFDFIVCCAAFKNFSEPVQAISEFHRVLKPGGKALINDLRRNASPAEIESAVNEMGLNWINRLLTRLVFRTFLLKNAYTPDELRAMVGQTKFGSCEIELDAIGMGVWLQK